MEKVYDNANFTNDISILRGANKSDRPTGLIYLDLGHDSLFF
jgi:hypothetical protein